MSICRGNSILSNLRDVMKSSTYFSSPLQAYIVPTNDSHQSEYIAACDCRNKFLSGFTGSSCTTVITEEKAALWTDGRYHLQAQRELNSEWTLMKDGLPETPSECDWLINVLPKGSFVGVDPTVVSFNSWTLWSSKLTPAGLNLVSVETNLVDRVWADRPPRPANIIEILPICYTGLSWQQKIEDVKKEMATKKATVLVISALDEIAWLFNLRGSDIDYNPVFFAYAVISLDCIHFFVDEKKLSPEARRQFDDSSDLKVDILPYESIFKFLSSLERNEKIWISKSSSYALVSLQKLFLDSENLLTALSPVNLKKAIKNNVEIQCMKNAHVKDAIALCEYFHWLETSVQQEEITEMSAAEKLNEFRKLQDDYIGPSFETISAADSNGAVIHYRPAEETNKVITADSMYLCDSGAQFRDGTTDVTRTMHFGIPSDHQKECYTRVLKGHIALSSAVFPNLTRGLLIDSFARRSLWDVGLDYQHGTGHGVGMYLNVHEGPAGISFKEKAGDPGLQEGMILSIEPGYYEENNFGIRIENLAVVVKVQTKFQTKKFLSFEPLTLVPMQTKLVDTSLLTAAEVKWLNDYNLKCRTVIGKALEQQGKTETLRWLTKETMPIV